MTERDSVRIIPGVGEVASQILAGLGISSIGDLLRWYPRTYLDASQPKPISELVPGRFSAIEVTILKTNLRRTKQRGIMILEAVCEDLSGQITARWFHQPYLQKKLTAGSRWILIGTPSYFQKERTLVSPLLEEQAQVLAVYGLSRGLSSKMLRTWIGWVLQKLEFANLLDTPRSVCESRNLLPRAEALRRVHQPKSMLELEQAQRALAFNEIFWFFAQLQQRQAERKQEHGLVILENVPLLQDLVADLPFQLMPTQKKAIWEIVQEMALGKPMARLLNGDVGSGKTVVAALVAAVVAKAGYQSIILAPTEVLAHQHLESIGHFLKSSGLSIGLWTASHKENQQADILIGTHALLQEGFKPGRLGLVVVDEQHRFGVKQRRLLRELQAKPPHLLSMTATPIPRTLALVLYGNLSVSVLTGKPIGRIPVETLLIAPNQRDLLHQRLLTELTAGHQAFVICPLIQPEAAKDTDPELQFQIASAEELTKQTRRAVLDEVERLRSEHPEYGRIEALHGKLKSIEKERLMAAFSNGEIRILVATSLVEVGVDIPNATVMVIEGAERFGLAQLHQLRGRVGRSAEQSYCFLCPSALSSQVRERLQILVDSQDGFRIAEKDLELRGPGELTGQVQSGLPDFRMASLTDLPKLAEVKEVVQDYEKQNPHFFQKYAEEGYSTLGGILE